MRLQRVWRSAQARALYTATLDAEWDLQVG